MTRNRILLSLLALSLTYALAPSGSALTDPPEVGKPAPSFTLTNQEGKQVSLSDYKGKWVVLYFYPKDFTSGCAVEARNFQRDIASYEKAKAVILGVSVDDAASHTSVRSTKGTTDEKNDPDAL